VTLHTDISQFQCT